MKYTYRNGIYQQVWSAADLGVTLPLVIGDAEIFLGPFDNVGWQYASLYGAVKADAITAPVTVVTGRVWQYSPAGVRYIVRTGGTQQTFTPGTDALVHESAFFIGNGQVGSDSIRDEAAVILGTSGTSPVWGFKQFSFGIIRSQPVAPNAATATISALEMHLRSR